MTKVELNNWYTNKKIRVWKRALFLLYREGDLSNREITDTLGADKRGVRRTLSKMQIGGAPSVVFKNHKWCLTSKGIITVQNYQKKGEIPIIVRGR